MTADGSRLLWRDREMGITVWDTFTGRRAVTLPALLACPLAWAGDDTIVSVEQYLDRETRKKDYAGPAPYSTRVAIRSLSSGEMRSFMSADVDYGRVAADANGTVIGTTAPLEQGVLVLDVANLKPRYHPSPTVAEPEGIRYLAISDGGAKAAVACGDIGPYRNPAGPASIFVVDMKTGVSAPCGRTVIQLPSPPL